MSKTPNKISLFSVFAVGSMALKMSPPATVPSQKGLLVISRKLDEA